MALSGDAQPHYSTLATFVSKLGDAAAKIFSQVLTICQRQGLIGREMFAIDGVKLPSNACKAKSGTRKDFLRQVAKMERAAQQMIARHRTQDAQKNGAEQDQEKQERKLAKLQREAKQMRDWLAENPHDRKGSRGTIRLSNRTDNESAKMATGKGVIQGYTGVAAVDEKHQIIVAAQAHGSGSEQELLAPMVEELKPLRTDNTVLSADSGYSSKANLERLEQAQIQAFIPDNDYRKRDARYRGQDHHQAKPDPLWDKGPKQDQPKLFRPEDFAVAQDFSHCVCPAGKRLYRNGANCNIGGHKAIKFTGAKRDCQDCPLRARCLRDPDKTRVRQVAIFVGLHERAAESALDRMKRKIDSDLGRQMISRRFATVEPVFGNLRHNKRVNRFTLRGRQKVDGQWKLYCVVHNIEKLARKGYAQ